MKKVLLLLVLCFTESGLTIAQEPEKTDSVPTELEEIIVRAQQPSTKLVGNTLVSVIPGTRLENLGTAVDVLRQLPMITATEEGISVVGRGEPPVYIDGRPVEDPEELVRLKSDNIRKIELDLAPGAMYPSEINAVIRITTRRNFVDGLSFTDRAEATVQRKISVSDMLDLNWRSETWDFFASGLVSKYNSTSRGSTLNSLIYNGKETVVGSTQRNSYPTLTGVVKVGFNHASGNESFGAYYRFNPERGDFTFHGSEWLDNETAIDRSIGRHISAHSHLISAYYENVFAHDYILHFDGNYKKSVSDTNSSTVYPGGESQNVSSKDDRNTDFIATKLYLTLPLLKGQLTVGTQDSYTATSLDYVMENISVAEYIPSSRSESRQTSLATFASWVRPFGKFNLSAGLRYEYSDYIFRLNGVRDKDVSRKDNIVTPDFSLSYLINDDSQVSLSYKSRRIRPPYSQLTGSLVYTGRHEIEGGNPALRDEREQVLQLFSMWKGFMFQSMFSKATDTYGFVKRIYPGDKLQLIMQPVNIDVTSLNLYLVWSRSIGFWTPDITVGMYKQWLDISGTRYDQPIFSYYFDNMFSLPAGFTLTVNAGGRSCGDMHTNRFSTSPIVVDASLTKSFFDTALQLKLSATDILNTSVNDWTMDTFGIRMDKRQNYENRGISLSVTYRFRPRQSKYKGKDADEAEMNRF